MDVALKARWVEVLRSDKYVQGRHALRTADNKFCCLGVLCDLVSPDSWTKAPVAFTVRGGWVYRHGQSTYFPQSEFLASIGTPREVKATHPFTKYASRNDSGATFAEIADMIERDPRL